MANSSGMARSQSVCPDMQDVAVTATIVLPHDIHVEATPVQETVRELVGEYGDLSGSWIYGGHHHPPLIGLQPLPGSSANDDQDMIMIQTEEEVVGSCDVDDLPERDENQVAVPPSALTAAQAHECSRRNTREAYGVRSPVWEASGTSELSNQKWEQAEVQISTVDGEFSFTVWTSRAETENNTESQVQENQSADDLGEEKTPPPQVLPYFDLSDPLQLAEFTHMEPEKKEEKPRPVPCPEEGCVKSFRDVTSMRKHLLTHGPKPHVCAQCGKAFVESSKLKRHYLVHTGEKPYLCTFEGCGKRFSLEFNLRTHQRIHSGDRPFTCPVNTCNKKFSQSTNLKTHLLTHAKKEQK